MWKPILVFVGTASMSVLVSSGSVDESAYGTVSEGSTGTYSEAEAWSYDGADDYDSSASSYTSGSYYEHTSTYYEPSKSKKKGRKNQKGMMTVTEFFALLGVVAVVFVVVACQNMIYKRNEEERQR